MGKTIDTAIGADALGMQAHVAPTDSGAGSDILAIQVRTFGAEGASGSDLLASDDADSIEDAFTLSCEVHAVEKDELAILITGTGLIPGPDDRSNLNSLTIRKNHD